MLIGTLTKLNHLKDGVVAEPYAQIRQGDTFKNYTFEPPAPGEKFFATNTSLGDGALWLRTTAVQSVYEHNSPEGPDKLVLPEGQFPDAHLIDFPELTAGDYLFATKNSIYHLGDVREWKEEKEAA